MKSVKVIHMATVEFLAFYMGLLKIANRDKRFQTLTNESHQTHSHVKLCASGQTTNGIDQSAACEKDPASVEVI